MKTYNIAVLSGDGIGEEVINEALKVLYSLPKEFNLEFKRYAVGGAGVDRFGDPLPKETLDGAKNSDAILFGAIGGKKWDSLEKHLRPEYGLLKLRKELGLYANVRPIKIYNALLDYSHLKRKTIEGSDFVIVRELTSGIYFGEPRAKFDNRAYNTMVYTKDEIKQIAIYAFNLAMQRKKKVCCVDKANVLETSVLWREVVSEVSKDYNEVELSFLYVDNASMQIIVNPTQFDVILTENLFGDILSDEASVIGGSIGLLASASIGDKNALFEPIHGSAPDIAGQNIANPLATIISAAMMLEHLGEFKASSSINAAIEAVLNDGYRTKDLDNNSFCSCSKMGDLVASYVTKV
ncbi:3-isopropylmalate dehydrogenase [Helicobacter sp. MIT 14-3879]|uniref:3-isopropylmalate dehydrogenase n=1 Tax=Helicobacter sp. MIT 14-3879 TaxID=2040649 RepID=UPI000E1F337F|nr:3-isopropylmalate dehydrogenase [Helicobacter sp. MIT 14-3879]RDU63983.1 3-isopropylmalate dehydrogenase [Helicobacter sp. MIT 14-3879]